MIHRTIPDEFDAGAQVSSTPDSVLADPAGSDFEFADDEQSIEYFKAIHAASDRIEVDSITQQLKHFRTS
ncbi:MAG: hypothetical protein ACPGPI_11585 [Longimicrobiales bacterium]